MKKLFTMFLCLTTLTSAVAQEQEVTTEQAKSMIKNTSKNRTSVHDPSIVWDENSGRYYIVGTHKSGAWTTDLQNWTWSPPTWSADNNLAFVTPAAKKVTKGGMDVDFPAFNAIAWSGAYGDYDVGGNMWAPDIIWNKVLKKWCIYLSINGPRWNSSIILLTSNRIGGPYQYQGPVVVTGFNVDAGVAGVSYKKTDLELAIGTQNTLPARYNVGGGWGNRWPHAIDPCVFYDEEGKLRLVYGSWSGGIWTLELDENTGLRDYNVTYPSVDGNNDNVTSDPYFGKKIAGGHYVSGEGPYIEYIGNYYYLFVTYGGLDSKGGYVMRMFRSKNPDGPFTDAAGVSAIFPRGGANFGVNADTRGVKVMGPYDKWGFMSSTREGEGELAQGHNSLIAAPDGRNYLVYHTRFNGGNEGHQVRVHQMFQTKNGWLVAAPFEYNGGQLTDEDIASKELFSAKDIAGTYQILIHKYSIDHANQEVVKPVSITLDEKGKVTGAYTGTWSITPGTSYLTIRLGSVTYNGVLMEQQMDGKNIQTVAFSALATTGVNVWGYKYRGDFALATQINSQTVPVTEGWQISKNIDLYNIVTGVENVDVEWTSDQPGIISNEGKYYPIGLTEDTPVSLTARLTSGSYFWETTINVKALSEAHAESTVDTWKDGMLARYEFDDEELTNSLNPDEKAELVRKLITKRITLTEGDPLRNGKVVHLMQSNNGKEDYVSIVNPLKGKELDGATISFFVKRDDDNLYDALFGCSSGTARLFLTGNLYMGFNDGKTADGAGVFNNWIDINHPNTVTTGKLGVDRWHQVTITFSRRNSNTGGINIYVDGSRMTDKYNGSLNGKDVTNKTAFDYNAILDLLESADELWLGNGSFWGTPDASFDDFIVYDRQLSLTEVLSLNQMTNRANQPNETVGIEDIQSAATTRTQDNTIYDLSGRRVRTLTPGIYIKNGEKFLVK